MADTVTERYPGQTDEAHPELFDLPPQPAEKKPGQLTQEQLKTYVTQGFLLVEDFFTREELEPAKEAIAGLVDDLAERLYKAGKIKNKHEDKGLYQRLNELEKEFPGTNVILVKQQNSMPDALQNLWCNERLLNVIEQLIGPDIAGNPIWNLRTKTPRNENTTVPWHQDNGYFDDDAYKTLIPTAWIPFIDATEENGCLQMVKGGHRHGKMATHLCCWMDTFYVMVEEEEMEKTLEVNMKEDVVTCPVKYGSFLLFNNWIPHRSLDNYSNDTRWSMDLRWQSPNKPYGYFGLKDGILMRKDGKTLDNINWKDFHSVDRTKVQAGAVDWKESEFDTTLHGPWMKRWRITHINRNTAALFESEKQK